MFSLWEWTGAQTWNETPLKILSHDRQTTFELGTEPPGLPQLATDSPNREFRFCEETRMNPSMGV